MLHCAMVQCVICSADPSAAAEFAALIQERAVALVEEISKNTKKEALCNGERPGRRVEESDSEDDDTEKDDSDEDKNEDRSPYAWIGKWIQKPKGECCRNPKEGREGFTIESLLKRARVTKGQYGMYKVRL